MLYRRALHSGILGFPGVCQSRLTWDRVVHHYTRIRTYHHKRRFCKFVLCLGCQAEMLETLVFLYAVGSTTWRGSQLGHWRAIYPSYRRSDFNFLLLIAEAGHSVTSLTYIYIKCPKSEGDPLVAALPSQYQRLTTSFYGTYGHY